MKKIFYIALTIVLGLAGTSCDREKLTYDSEPGEISGKTGTLDLSSFDAIPNNDIKETEKKPISRAVDTGGFTVQIFRADNGSETLEKNWKYSETPEIVTLNIGNYNLKVFSHEVQPAEWEKPYYYADKTFSIEENRVTQIDTLVCTLQNIKVSVSYSEDLKTLMGEDCKVSVTVGEGVLDFMKEESRAGYFRSDKESNLLIATFSGTIDGYEEVNRIQVDNVKAGEWPGTKPDPGPDPEPTDAPKITSATVKLGTPVPVTEGLQVIVDITSSDKNGLTGLVVDIDSPTLTPDELAGMGLASHLDLVNPGDLKTAIEGLGFPTGSNVLNQSKVTFDISNFMPLLGLLGAGTHNFIIKATDAQGTTTETLILVTE